MVTAFAAYGDWRARRPSDVEADIILSEFSELPDHIGISDQ